MAPRRIVVAVDFGTTYSGIAWSDTTRPDVQNVIENWPARGGETANSPKVPTELRKIAKGHQWGFQIPVEGKRSKYFKLKLDGEKAWEGSLSPEELSKIYLEHLFIHCRRILELRLSAAVVDATPIDYILTVPAIWSEDAKEKARLAADQGGFKAANGGKPLSLVSEPEAAAVYSAHKLGPSVLGVGKKFVLCDAGGGTVDLVTYEILQTDKIKLRPVTEGTGGKCGSSILNQRFRRQLKKSHGEKYWTDERLIPALSEFETYKMEWHPCAEALVLQMDPSKGLPRNRFMVPMADMAKVIEPVMRDVVELINEQVQKAGEGVAAVVLVGGFGQNKHLGTRVQDSVGSSISVLQPEDGWTAVVRGAAMIGTGQAAVDRTDNDVAVEHEASRA